jgi:hypothetical protein
MKTVSLVCSCAASLMVSAGIGLAAEVPKAPVPSSPFIRVVYGFADAVLKNGRDRSGALLSALDPNTLALLTNRPGAPAGVGLRDRVGSEAGPLVGVNPQHDENLLRLLSTLSDLSSKPHYRAAADAELKWFVENSRPGKGAFFRPWMLWDRCFELSPAASKQLVAGLVQSLNTTGALDSQRNAGFNLRAWSVAYAHTKEESLFGAIDVVLSRYETNAALPPSLSLAIDCDGAAHRVPEPLALRLREVAKRQDGGFCSLPHDVNRKKSFLIQTANSIVQSNQRRTALWKADSAGYTTAQVGMMCVSRYDNTGRTAYRDLIFAAADAYLNSLPADEEDAWPATFGHAISLELAAWRHSANHIYMERARTLGDWAVQKFWGTNPLPRASLKTYHYEAITGADTLALALLELHLNILHITAVRCPPNTIDR